MEIILSNQEAEEYFYNALCNGLGYVCNSYELSLDLDMDEYKKAKDDLSKQSPPNDTICYEDVMLQMLRNGNKLTLVDEGGGDDSWSITLDDVHKRMNKVPPRHLMDMMNENDDGITADAIIQSVFMDEIIFG